MGLLFYQLNQIYQYRYSGNDLLTANHIDITMDGRFGCGNMCKRPKFKCVCLFLPVIIIIMIQYELLIIFKCKPCILGIRNNISPAVPTEVKQLIHSSSPGLSLITKSLLLSNKVRKFCSRNPTAGKLLKHIYLNLLILVKIIYTTIAKLIINQFINNIRHLVEHGLCYRKLVSYEFEAVLREGC